MINYQRSQTFGENMNFLLLILDFATVIKPASKSKSPGAFCNLFGLNQSFVLVVDTGCA